MTVTEQGCAELAERLSDPFYRGSSQHLRSWSEIDELFMRSATILSRLTVDDFAIIIRKASHDWTDGERGVWSKEDAIAQALLDHITAETEVRHDHIR